MDSIATLFCLYFFYFYLLYVLININKYSINKQKLIARNSLIIITIIAGARWNTGTDWEPYLEYYNLCKDGQSCPTYFEPSYLLINQINSYLGISYSYVLLMAAIISNFAFYKFITKTNIPVQGLLALFTYGLGNLIIIRSTIAQSIGLYALTFNIIGFIFLIILASSFHYSAIFTFAYYYVRKANILFLFLFLIIFSLFIVNLQLTVGYLPNLNIFDFTKAKIDIYFGGDFSNSTELSLFSIVHKLILIYLIIKYRYLVDKLFTGLSTLALFGVLLGIILSYFSSVLLRFAGYFEPFIYIYIAILFSYSINNLKNYFIGFTCLILLVLKFSYLIYYNYDLIVPYEFFFEEHFKNVY